MIARRFKFLAAAVVIAVLLGGFYLSQSWQQLFKIEEKQEEPKRLKLDISNYEKARNITTTKEGDAASKECRDKLQKRGVILQSGPCIDIDAIVTGLSTGTYTFNKPKYAYVDEPFQVLLVLKTAPEQDVQVLFRTMPGSTEKREAPVAQILSASIRGGDFGVSPSGPQMRTFTSLAPLEWQWSVTPLKTGDKELIIDVSADLVIDKEKTQVTLKVLREPIEIRVDPYRWMKAVVGEVSTIIALFAAAVSGLIGLIAPIRRKFLSVLRRGHLSNVNDRGT